VANTSAEVDQFMARLEHLLKEGVQRLRTTILASNDTITEHIKWNAPSFRHAGQDRVTFRLQPGDKLQLLFHRGAKVRTDTAAFAFNDPTGLMTWLAGPGRHRFPRPAGRHDAPGEGRVPGQPVGVILIEVSVDGGPGTLVTQGLMLVAGTAGFEPATPCSQSQIGQARHLRRH
jgi:hypothetical protein